MLHAILFAQKVYKNKLSTYLVDTLFFSDTLELDAIMRLIKKLLVDKACYQIL